MNFFFEVFLKLFYLLTFGQMLEITNDKAQIYLSSKQYRCATVGRIRNLAKQK